MAAPMDHHRRKTTCDVRPAYRDGRKEKAVKVYTVNQESRFLLIQGVPDIKVTEELLKLFSLYGTIDEYQILDDYPAEQFTKVYWIKLADIQAARVAKRKMDDRPFYGGTLHVSYAPEYESVMDTRHKLQERRKDVAKRLRNLHRESRATALSTGLDKSTKSTISDDGDPLALTSSSKAPTNPDLNTSRMIDLRKLNPTPSEPCAEIDSHQSVDDGASEVHTDVIPQQLPAPPKPLPAWQWKDPVTSCDQYPRLPTAHATLPSNFNPYPDGYDESHQASIHDESKSQSDTSSHVTSTHTLTHTVGEPVSQRNSFDSRIQAGARPKFKLRHERKHGSDLNKKTNQGTSFLERVAWRNDKQNMKRSSSSEINAGLSTINDQRTQETTLKRSHPQSLHPSSQIPSGLDRSQTNSKTSSFMPRQLLGKRKHPASPCELEHTGYGLGSKVLERDTGQKVDNQTGSSTVELPSVSTGNASFDLTVQSIRQRMMRNVAQVPGNEHNDAQQQGADRPAAAPRPAAADGQSATKRPRI